MRIIAGHAKGRRLVAPRGEQTRPMQDRVKEAIFSSLGARVIDADVLDLYAGTGSMGLEALSRGAHRVVFVERDRHALKALRTNCENVGLGGDIVGGEVRQYLARASQTFDLVFVDPPYADDDAAITETMELVARCTGYEGTVILHRGVGSSCPEVESLVLEDERRYGGAQLWRFQKESA